MRCESCGACSVPGARLLLWFIIVTDTILIPSSFALADSVMIAAPNKPGLDIVMPMAAEEHVIKSAEILAEYLGRMSGQKLTLRRGEAPKADAAAKVPAIYVGTAADKLPVQWQGAALAPTDLVPDAYRLLTNDRGLWLVGAEKLGLRFAVWDVLHRLGYRQFFPGEIWEIVPPPGPLSIDIDDVEVPDYRMRWIWYNFGRPYNPESYADWNEKNRMPGGYRLRTGHIYGWHILRNQEAFDAHPEYFSLVNGERRVYREGKFCVSNEGLQQLIVASALRQAADNPGWQSISMDPSDGGGWCQCEPCAEIGTPSDQALHLANLVAQAIEDAGYDMDVGMYAYNQHSPPPTRVRAHPRVVISVATAFLSGGLTVEQIHEGWKAMGVQRFGVRDYYSVFAWNRGMPGASRVADLNSLAQRIATYHRRGANYMSAEAGDAWGSSGLSFFIASRVLWDTDEADQVDAIREDFLKRAFPGVTATMRRFFELIYTDRRPFISQDHIGRMYRLLDEATRTNTDPAVQARLDALVLYTRYVELYRRLNEAPPTQRLSLIEPVIRHAYRIRHTGMVHTMAVYRSLHHRVKVRLPEEVQWIVPEDANPWKSSEPFTRQELNAILTNGIANHELYGFEPVAFSRDLIPAWPMLTGKPPSGPDLSLKARGLRTYYTWVEQPPATIQLTVTGGLIENYRDRGDVTLELFHHDNPDFPVATAAVPPTGKPTRVDLRSDQPGLHRLIVDDGMDLTEITWPGHLPVTWEASPEASPMKFGRHDFVFYVQPDAKVVGGYNRRKAANAGLLYPDRSTAIDFTDHAGHFEIAIPPTMAGKVWSGRRVFDRVALMTTPPYVAPRMDLLLLPREVVKHEKQAVTVDTLPPSRTD